MSHNWIRHKQPLPEPPDSGSVDGSPSNLPERGPDLPPSGKDDPDVQVSVTNKNHAGSQSISRQWEMRLIFVDDRVTFTLLSRLLATESRVTLLDHPVMSDIKQDFQQSRVPSDLNSALIAARLLEIGVPLVSDLGEQEMPYLDQPVRLEGIIKKVESELDSLDPGSPGALSADLYLHIKGDQGAGSILLLKMALSYGWTAADLEGRRILAIGLLRRPRDRVVVAAAVMQLERFDKSA